MVKKEKVVQYYCKNGDCGSPILDNKSRQYCEQCKMAERYFETYWTLLMSGGLSSVQNTRAKKYLLVKFLNTASAKSRYSMTSATKNIKGIYLDILACTNDAPPPVELLKKVGQKVKAKPKAKAKVKIPVKAATPSS